MTAAVGSLVQMLAEAFEDVVLGCTDVKAACTTVYHDVDDIRRVDGNGVGFGDPYEASQDVVADSASLQDSKTSSSERCPREAKTGGRGGFSMANQGDRQHPVRHGNCFFWGYNFRVGEDWLDRNWNKSL